VEAAARAADIGIEVLICRLGHAASASRLMRIKGIERRTPQ